MTAKPTQLKKKHLILHAAISLFIKNGVAGTKMKDVASAAGVDQPLIRYYFPTADLLYLDMIEVVAEHLTLSSAGVAEKETDPVLVLKNYLIGTMEWGEKNPGYFSLWLYFYYMATFNPVFMQLDKKYREEGRERITLFIYRGLEKGVYRLPDGARVADIALNIQGLLTGNIIMAATEGPVDWVRFKAETVRGCFGMLGIAPPP